MERIAAAEGDAWPALNDRLGEVQAQFDALGFVTTEGDWEPAISAAAAPVDLGDGRTPLGLSVGGAARWLNGSFLHDQVGPLLVSAARDRRRDSLGRLEGLKILRPRQVRHASVSAPR